MPVAYHSISGTVPHARQAGAPQAAQLWSSWAVPLIDCLVWTLVLITGYHTVQVPSWTVTPAGRPGPGPAAGPAAGRMGQAA
jgi:hypothetical protein